MIAIVKLSMVPPALENRSTADTANHGGHGEEELFLTTRIKKLPAYN